MRPDHRTARNTPRVTVDAQPELDRYQRLTMILNALNGDLGMEEIASIIVNQGMAGMDASGAGIGFIAGDKWYRVAAVGSTARSIQRLERRSAGLPLDAPIPACLAIRTGEEVWVTDRAAGLRRFPHLVHASKLSQGWAALPLKHHGTTFGTFSLSFVRPPVFDSFDREFIRSLGDIAALALAPIFEASVRADAGDADTDPLSRALGSVATDGLVAVDSAGTIVECNDRLCQLLGYQAAQLIGRSIEVLLPLDRRQKHALERSRYVENPVPRSEASGLDLVALRADGTELPVEVTLSPCTTPMGQRTLAVVRARL